MFAHELDLVLKQVEQQGPPLVASHRYSLLDLVGFCVELQRIGGSRALVSERQYAVQIPITVVKGSSQPLLTGISVYAGSPVVLLLEPEFSFVRLEAARVLLLFYLLMPWGSKLEVRVHRLLQ